MHVYWPNPVKRKSDAIRQQISYELNDKYEARVESLRRAASEYPDPAAIFEEGLSFLAIHRNNYTSSIRRLAVCR